MTDSPTPTPDNPAGRLRLRDVRAVFRLVGEVRELGADPDRWRPHMVRRLRDMLEAEVVVSSEIHFRRTTGGAGASAAAGVGGKMRVVDIGWIGDAAGDVFKAQSERDGERPEDFWLKQVGATPAAGDLVPVRPEPAQAVHGGSCFLLSQVALPHAGAVDQLGLHRAWGERPFTRAEHKLARLLHVELARLWRRDALRRARQPETVLPPRLAQTLEELLAGGSEKQIAQKLELSPHTVHNYVKALHQRFGVSSRGELLAKARETQSFTPQLSFDPPRGA